MENNRPQRKTTRLEKFDYNSSGAYFITFCTFEKRMMLSHIVGAIHESPKTCLSERGKIVADVIEHLPERLHVKVADYVIMPNHVHMMLIVPNEPKRAIHESPLHRRSVVSKVVGYIKMNASKTIRKTYGDETVWQRNYYDHIVRGEEDYQKIMKYIAENPSAWETDRYFES